MFRSIVLTAFLLPAVLAPVTSARAQFVDDDRYNIMRPEKGSKAEQPEPWLAPKYKSPRGLPQHAVIPRSSAVPQSRTDVPPPLYVPQTGQSLPNLPAIGNGPGGRETSQDRAVRCAHQAGVYGQAAGNPNSYIGGCINQ